MIVREVHVPKANYQPGKIRELCQTLLHQYQTSPQQHHAWDQLCMVYPRHAVPIQWTVEVAEQDGGWFLGVAHHICLDSHRLHVTIPDTIKPSFDGYVDLHPRIVHLLDCLDGCSQAIFNQLVLGSVKEVFWKVEWEFPSEKRSRWAAATVRGLVRLTNQLLLEDREGFLLMSASKHIRFLKCFHGKSDYNFLLKEAEVLGKEDNEIEAIRHSEASSGSDTAPLSSPDISLSSLRKRREIERLKARVENLEEELERKQKQLQDREDRFLCLICSDRPRNVVFMNCRHCCLCSFCFDKMKRADPRFVCVVCRAEISREVNIFFP
eukprot:gene198-210_t